MKKAVLVILLVLVLVLSVVPTVFAAEGQLPQGACPPGFETHDFGEHEDHEHHVGLTVDLNGDGSICVKHLDNGLHVHADNVIQ